MGQRLVVDILDNGERIANVYYHWAAHFDSTISQLEYLKNDIADAKRSGKKDILLAIIEGLEKRGGGLGIDTRTRQAAKKEWPEYTFTLNVNRNDGLLFIEEQDMDETYAMNEGTASIDISTEEVNNDVTREAGIFYHISDLPCNPFDTMSFDQLEQVCAYIDKVYEERFKKIK